MCHHLHWVPALLPERFCNSQLNRPCWAERNIAAWLSLINDVINKSFADQETYVLLSSNSITVL